MDIETLKKEVATHLSDPAMKLVSGGQLLLFINSAARDAGNEGWLVDMEESETTQLVAEQWDYEVPASFIYIDELWLENPTTSSLFDRFLPYHHWSLAYDGGKAVIRFDSQSFTIEPDKYVKVKGQKRPSTYAADTDTVDPGMESFLRERAVSYGARYLSVSGSGFSRQYAGLSDRCYATSERLLSSHPQKFRQRPNARSVPGR